MSERTPIGHKPTSLDVIQALASALKTLRASKPEDRTERDRRYAVTITDLEKVIAYFMTYVTPSITEAQL